MVQIRLSACEWGDWEVRKEMEQGSAAGAVLGGNNGICVGRE